MTRIALVLWLAGAGAKAVGCGTARIERQPSVGTPPAATPILVYVADFDFDLARLRSEPGIFPPPTKPAAPFGALWPSPPGAPSERGQLARHLVDSMSTALVEELTQAGFDARRLPKASAPPNSGWLVQGVFTEVNQGNQLRRAVVGLGQGKTELRMMVNLHDLSLGTPKPFHELVITADSGNGPGSAAIVTRFPAAIAARFVLAGKDLDRNVRQTAGSVAEQVAQQARILR